MAAVILEGTGTSHKAAMDALQTALHSAGVNNELAYILSVEKTSGGVWSACCIYFTP